MAKRQSYLVMSIPSDSSGKDIWHIIDGRRVVPTGFQIDQHVAARRAFKQYQIDKEQPKSPPARKKALRKALPRRTARTRQ
ncbi:hypothetical protein [Bradyrhizobium sp. LA2.1]|uniref:hypothetical protein n=1 Tax=Bradyrhizobium sp. LA2.1 TaxID=3156376 RepID=UPI003393CFB4